MQGRAVCQKAARFLTRTAQLSRRCAPRLQYIRTAKLGNVCKNYMGGGVKIDEQRHFSPQSAKKQLCLRANSPISLPAGMGFEPPRICAERPGLRESQARLAPQVFRKQAWTHFRPFCDNKLYEFLSRTPRLAASKTDFAPRKRELFRTGMLGISTGILGVFPTCTSRRHCMYI